MEPIVDDTVDLKGKRKDLMTNIKSRLEDYDVDKFYKKNEKDLAAKVKFFEKKQANGTFKEFMRPRYEEAKVLLEKVHTLKATPLVEKAPVAKPVEAPKPVERKEKAAVVPKRLPRISEEPINASMFVEDEIGANYFLRKEVAAALPLPQFYDPYTGRKFAPEENPMPPIERAYTELKALRATVYKKAKTARSLALSKLKKADAAKSRRATRRRHRRT